MTQFVLISHTNCTATKGILLAQSAAAHKFYVNVVKMKVYFLSFLYLHMACNLLDLYERKFRSLKVLCFWMNSRKLDMHVIQYIQ